MKKTAVFLFALTLMLFSLCFAVSAEDTVDIIVSVPSQTDVKSGAVSFTFDSNAMEIVGGEWTLAKAPKAADFKPADCRGVFVYSSGTSFGGDVFVLKARLKNGATFADANVSVEVQVADSANAMHTVDATACAHDFSAQNTDAKYRVSAASCESPAVYRYSCVHCGAKGNKTFLSGDALPHTFDKEIAEEAYLKEIASCQGPAVYYVSCKCGAKGSDTFTYGEPASHVFENDCDTTCEKCDFTRETSHAYATEYSADAENHWYECSVCEEKKDVASHTPDGMAKNCTVCGRELPTANAKPSVVWNKQNGGALILRSEQPFAEFVGVSVNGTKLSPEHYTVREGSTIVTLNAAYLESLTAGEYVVVIRSENGSSVAAFAVEETSAEQDDAQSGSENGAADGAQEHSHILFIVLIVVLAVLVLAEGVALVLFCVRKKEK